MCRPVRSECSSCRMCREMYHRKYILGRNALVRYSISMSAPATVLSSVSEHITQSLPSATKLRRLCFLYLSVCPQGGVSASVHAGIPPPPPGAGTPLGAGTPQSRHPRRAGTPQSRPPGTRHPPSRHPPQQTATVADGTHPTGMHSCFLKFQSSFLREVAWVLHEWNEGFVIISIQFTSLVDVNHSNDIYPVFLNKCHGAESRDKIGIPGLFPSCDHDMYVSLTLADLWGELGTHAPPFQFFSISCSFREKNGPAPFVKSWIPH